MTFTLEMWKEKVSGRLSRFGGWLERRKTRDAPYLLYGSLCGMSLWPLVEAVRTGQTLPVMVALGAVAGGVGGNLLAEQVQRWKDRADEAEVAGWVAGHAPADADLREALDRILEQLDAVTQARAGLSEADRDWFAATLRGELSQLGNLARFEATLGGDVVIGAKTTTFDQRAQAVHGPQTNIVRATGPVLSGTFNIYRQPLGRPQLSEAQFERIINDYLTWVLDEYGRARLHGLQSLQGSGPYRKPLSAVYTSLRVSRRPAVEPGGLERLPKSSRLWKSEELVDMADLLTLGRRAAIVGGAGCGKTTYLAFVAASLAAALGGQELDTRLKPGRPDALLPIPFLAPLRFWNVFRQEVNRTDGIRYEHPEAGTLKDFLLWYLRHSYKNFDAAGDFFERLLRGGGGLIMFDGLDEVVSREERLVVRDAISRLFDRSPYQDNLCLVTAREAGYRDAPFGSDFVRCDVQAMDDGQIAALVDAWCRDIPELEVARERIARVVGELNEERRGRGQEPLVSTPLMVTMIVSVYYSKKELPRERARLYDAVTDVILQSQYSEADEVGARKLVVTWGEQLPPDKQREWLSLLAFLMHRAGDQGAVVDEGRVRALLTPPLRERGELARLDTFIAQAEGRGGLFELRGEQFQFMHLTFQEYLAGQHLASQWRDEKERLPLWVTEGWWREALLLTIGSLDHPRPFRERSDFITCLLALDADVEAQLAAAELAASGLLDLSQAEDVLCDQARERLLALLTDPTLSGVTGRTRAAAGRALAALGDPRDFDELVTIPPGPFLMGSSDVDEMADKDEKPQHEVSLPAFKIGKYPVTNARFAAFVEAGGYRMAELWREAAQAGWWQDGRFKGRYDDEPRARPVDYGPPFNLPNHPVVGVSWYEALAFCRWLTGVWRAEGVIAGGEVVRLPSEAEWEKAASWEGREERGERRGGRKRRYPWGDEPDLNRANYGETGIGSTSAVGCFPDGASPCGCLDMAGNVWEWTSSQYKGYPYDPADGRENLETREGDRRVLRGGAFRYDLRHVRCAYRDWDDPDSRDGYRAFRIVVSPISPPSAL
jgi:formylglycine-generating enzyme required for sulfatase activity